MDPSVFTVEAMAMLDGLALAAIAGYQRWISPHKGFRCAYRAHTGRCSCSQLGARAIRRFGTFDGIVVLKERLHRCGVAFRRFGASVAASRTSAVPPANDACAAASPTDPASSRKVPQGQRGDCDVIACVPLDVGACDAVDCSPASGTSLDCGLSPLDLLDCGDCAGDSRKKTEEERQRQALAEAAVHLPPRRARP